MKNTLITGGAGFIGSHLSELLIANGHKVTVLDSLVSGKLSNLSAIQNHPNFSFLQADILDKEAIEPAFENIDWVFHLAGLADIVPSIESPTEYFNVNVTGTHNVLEAARRANVNKIIYAASSSSYGIPETYPTPETSPIKPEYPYALTKHMGEELVMHWNQVYGLSAISLRLFNVYGPRSRTAGAYGAVFGVFLAQKLKGHPLTVVGDGQQTRDFTHVSDVVNAFYIAAKSDISNQVMNVGSGNHYSVNRLVELIGGEIKYIPKRPGEPDCTFADTSKIERLLSWNAITSLEEGVTDMIKHIEMWNDAPVWTPETIETATSSWFQLLGKNSHGE